MKSGFKDPTGIKSQKPMDEPKDGKKSPWDYRCPQYDQRSSCFVNAGTDYGVGHKQPIGHEGNPKQRVDVMPMDHPRGMKIDEKA
jgi:hypothetical protein